MIERRQRNDFVRRREFDMLRKLRQREAAGGRDPRHAVLLQCQQHLRQDRGPRAHAQEDRRDRRADVAAMVEGARPPRARPAADGAPADGRHMAAQHARAYADTVPGVPQGGRRRACRASCRPTTAASRKQRSALPTATMPAPRRSCCRRSRPTVRPSDARRHLARPARPVPRDRRRREVRGRQHPLCAAHEARRRPNGFRSARLAHARAAAAGQPPSRRRRRRRRRLGQPARGSRARA